MIGGSSYTPVLALSAVLALSVVLLSFAVSLPLALVGGLAVICAAVVPATPLSMLVILLTLSPLRSLIATESGLDLPLDIGQLLLLLYFGVWMAARINSRKPWLAMQPSVPLAAALGLTAVFAVGAWHNASLSHWLREWLKWVVISLVIWNMTLSYSRSWRWLVYALLLSAAANAVVGLYIFLGGSGADHLVILGRFFRAFGTFGQPNPFGGFMGIALPLGLMTALSQIPVIVRVWRAKRQLSLAPTLVLALSGLASLLIVAALLASWSRGAWLGMAVAILIMLLALPRKFVHGLVLTMCLAAMFGLAWTTGLLPSSIVGRLASSVSELVSVSDVRGVAISPWNYAVIERLAHWQAAVNMATDSPLLGVGLGGYEVVYDRYRLINWDQPLGHAHNHYLNMLAETGILGLAGYLAFWLVIVRLTLSLRRHPDEFSRYVAVALLGCWAYIAVHSLFDNLYVNNLFLHIGVLLGVLAILQRQMTRSLELE